MDIVTLAAARKSGGSGGDVTKQYVDDHLALKADKTETAEYPIASTTTGVNPSITDSAESTVQELTIYGRSRKSKNILDPNKVMSGFDVNNDVFSNTLTDTFTDFHPRITADGSVVALSGSFNLGENHITFSIPTTTTLIIKHNGQSRNLDIVSLSNVPAGDFVWSFNLLENDPTTVGGLRFSEMMICSAADYEIDPSYEPYGIHSIGDSGSLVVATTNSDSTKTSTTTLTTGLPLCGIPVTTNETYTDESGQKWLADTADVEGVVKRCYKVTFDGSEDEGWTQDSSSPVVDNSKRFFISVDQIPKTVETTATPNGVINGSVLRSASYTWSTGAGTSFAYSYIQVRVPNVLTLEGFKPYLASNPITIVYELAEPYEIPLTASEIAQLRGLKTYNPVTNVTITDDPTVDIGYLLNTDNGRAVADVQNELQEQIIAIPAFIASIPEMHRNIFRGKSLGSSVTAAQLAAIADGSFDDLYVGDYWTIPTTIGGVTTSIKYRIADIDYLLGTGEYPDHILDKHHLVIVPDTALDTAVMGSNNYWTSTLRTTNIAAIKTALDAIFPNMILPFYLQPTVTDPTYLQCYVEVMSAYMVYGHQGLYIDDDRSPIDKTQLALFALAPKAITVPDTSYWLNTRLSDTTRMQAVTKAGEMWRGTVASSQYGIRPFFLIGDAT